MERHDGETGPGLGRDAGSGSAARRPRRAERQWSHASDIPVRQVSLLAAENVAFADREVDDW
ncbi:hypothetical protein Lfu02_41090 [Longispora fulva]|nr:hypothetical protein Lfu02_41090 [Longispora fulva]